MQRQNGKIELMIGAVAYAPKVVTIWEGIREYLHDRGLQTEYVLYSSYPALVDALVAGHIDIAWNTPLAYLQAKERLGGRCLVLGMRDSDIGFTTVFIARADSPIHSLSDLKGKRFALGSRDSSHAAILPLHFLREAGLDPEKDLNLVRFDTDLGKHGDTGTSEQDVVRTVTEGSADAGAIGKATWDAFVAAGSIDSRTLGIFWTSPGYSHCNFTARAELPASLAERFTKAIQAMDYSDPKWKQI
ncbi:MAG: PhnD/SsuA/transferrin family substrate-binding protein, partial [Deltaproteobacteria bacterium]|nr:PhnD/SsuA/transferrin family substrate-binding protein [Deltaproteobacteria bacterium]